MTRLVSVRYLVPVYATVDLDAEPIPDPTPGTVASYPDSAVTEVYSSESDILRLDDSSRMADLINADVIDDAYDEWGDVALDRSTLSAEDRAKALEIAENTIWPAWEHG